MKTNSAVCPLVAMNVPHDRQNDAFRGGFPGTGMWSNSMEFFSFDRPSELTSRVAADEYNFFQRIELRKLSFWSSQS
jgi:hypothetical protein